MSFITLSSIDEGDTFPRSFGADAESKKLIWYRIHFDVELVEAEDFTRVITLPVAENVLSVVTYYGRVVTSGENREAKDTKLDIIYDEAKKASVIRIQYTDVGATLPKDSTLILGLVIDYEIGAPIGPNGDYA